MWGLIGFVKGRLLKVQLEMVGLKHWHYIAAKMNGAGDVYSATKEAVWSNTMLKRRKYVKHF